MTEPSRLIVGSTGSGKSIGEMVELVRLAGERKYAVVLLDGHGPLAFRTAGHWEARGHEDRMIYEPLHITGRVLCWPMLPKSAAPTLPQRELEDAQTLAEVTQCLLAQRNLETLNDRPWTKEWLEAAIRLCLSQPGEEPLPALLSAFQVGSRAYERLLNSCERAEVVGKFRGMETLRRRSLVEYERQTGAARRLLELVCTSEIVRLRARPGPFNWLQSLRDRKLIAFDGGGVRSPELKRTLFLLASMAVIHAVRRHFAGTRSPLPVVLVLEEAGAHDLVTPFVLTALQELRKAGLAIHIITQSSLDFGDRAVFEAVLANTPWQAWYQVLSPADQELGAKALTNAAFDPYAVHFTRPRFVPDGVEKVKTLSQSESADPKSGRRHVQKRLGFVLRTKYREVVDAYYKNPQLQEQEFRTQLATLHVGERIVRDRASVRRELVTALGPSRPLGLSEEYARAAIGRIRRQPIYQAVDKEPAAAAEPRESAAAVLRQRGREKE